jgi:hypothetical protein
MWIRGSIDKLFKDITPRRCHDSLESSRRRTQSQLQTQLFTLPSARVASMSRARHLRARNAFGVGGARRGVTGRCAVPFPIMLSS